jgi:exoribonuclease R
VAVGPWNTRIVTSETQVTVKLDSASVFEALRQQLGDWRLAEHSFDVNTDEVRMSYDSGGTGRVAITIGFELTLAEMARLMAAAQPAD